MAKSQKLEAAIALLNEVRSDPTAAASIATLRQVLSSKHAVAVAQAAKLVGEAAIAELTPELVTAFDRFMIKPESTDVGCIAKFRTAEALYKLESREADVFLQGIRHVQLEPVWGGREDTAASLRGVCALGLVRISYPDVMSELADLLADPIPAARTAAIRAIAYSGDPQGVPLLRLKAHVGDDAPQVLSDCFATLLQLAPARSLLLVCGFLDADSLQISELAALAIGESRLPEALPLLQDWWQRTPTRELRKAALLAIAMLRHDPALDFLLSLAAAANLADAKDAIAALSLYQSDDRLWQRVQDAVASREDANLLRRLL